MIIEELFVDIAQDTIGIRFLPTDDELITRHVMSWEHWNDKIKPRSEQDEYLERIGIR